MKSEEPLCGNAAVYAVIIIIIARAVRQRVLNWARFVFRIIFVGVDFRSLCWLVGAPPTSLLAGEVQLGR